MSQKKPPTELQIAVRSLSPFFWKAFGFSLLGGLLMLVPTVYMLEVYDRVVNSRSHLTLVMLTLMVVFAFVVMEVLEWARCCWAWGPGCCWTTSWQAVPA